MLWYVTEEIGIQQLKICQESVLYCLDYLEVYDESCGATQCLAEPLYLNVAGGIRQDLVIVNVMRFQFFFPGLKDALNCADPFKVTAGMDI